jgi:hypothetical protein
VKLPQPRHQLRVVAPLIIAGDRPDDHMISGMTAGPSPPDRVLLTDPHDGDHHPIQQQACDPLAIGRCRRRGPSDGGKVVGQRQEFLAPLGR